MQSFSWNHYVFNELSLGLHSEEPCKYQGARASALSDTFTFAVPSRAAIWYRGWLSEMEASIPALACKSCNFFVS